MAAVPSAAADIDFEFLDITNLQSLEAGHMTRIIFRFKDAKHFSEEWTWNENGKDEVTTFYFVHAKH